MNSNNNHDFFDCLTQLKKETYIKIEKTELKQKKTLNTIIP